jgi:hypothetical protein
LAFELDVRLKAGRVPSSAQALLIEHPSAIEPAQDECQAARLAQALDLARHVHRTARDHVGAAHNNKPSVNSNA